MVGIFQLKVLTPQIEGIVKCPEIAYWTYRVVHQRGTLQECKRIHLRQIIYMQEFLSSVVYYPRNIYQTGPFYPRYLFHWKLLKIEALTSATEVNPEDQLGPSNGRVNELV